MIEDLKEVDWVSHIEPLRTEESRPEHVVRYLFGEVGRSPNACPSVATGIENQAAHDAVLQRTDRRDVAGRTSVIRTQRSV